MIAPLTHILPLTTIRRERLLPANGRVLVHAGQKVLASDVLAECHPHNPHLLFDTAYGLGVTPQEADTLAQRKTGDRVIKGDVLAGPVGLLNRVVRAPENGVVKVVGEGQLLMEIEGAAFELRAGMPGVVAEVIPDRGAIIEATGALIQGVWGNGKTDNSLLVVLAHAPDEEFTAKQMDVGMRGSVLLAAILMKEEALQTAIGLPLRGLILASMPAQLIPLAQQAPFPIILLEGFGRIPLNPVAYSILTTNEQRDVTVNAAAWDHQTGIRPEVVIPLPTSSPVPPPPETTSFAPGQTIHVRRGAFAGQTGTLANLRNGLSQYPSGVRAPAAAIHLTSGEKAIIPLINLEVIE
ncbi:MAG: hypothetical protein PHQ40_09495 [Anaerolineaceae bacterium]|nr:hypothetical protein [Anaerolineaceae bacterium]